MTGSLLAVAWVLGILLAYRLIVLPKLRRAGVFSNRRKVEYSHPCSTRPIVLQGGRTARVSKQSRAA
ncbi:unannotated protein [freshwater metagenome]|uniref:Unannotated protein n=1 Tax=freshwater metagenome TaxID=449393 RepID=A0A6J7CN23_9ZZZZ|nr:hypothetical protein [Actinomycetota bacterium]